MIFIRLKSYRFPIAIFVISRVVMWIGMFLAINIFLPPQPIVPAIQQIWLHWDATWYLLIAAHGYKFILFEQSTVVFFPLLPMLIRLIGSVIDPLTAGLLIVNACTLLAYVLLYALVRLEFPDDERIARRALLYIAFFPTAIFSALIYTEGLMLMLSLAVFYFARRGLWSWSIAAAILACATHANGIFVFAVVVLEWARAHGLTLTTILRRVAWRSFFDSIRSSPLTVAAIILIPFGLFSFMRYESVSFGSPLLFLQMQSLWGRLVGGPYEQTIGQITAFVNALLAGKQLNVEALLNIPSFLLALALIPLIWRKLGTSYGLFTLANVALPAWTSLASFSRYASILFPVFIILALWGKRSAVHQAIFTLFCTVMGVVIVVYVSNTFIA